MELNIVELIENNPITKLTGNYQSKLIEKVKNNFTNYEQQIFLSSFYCYLNYDYKNDFVVDLDNVWKWLGFSQKDAAKRLLEKCFVLDNGYKVLLHTKVEQKKGRGGHNKDLIMLNIDTFKKFCLKAGTKKADEIHDYFIKLEQVLQEILLEESSEFKLQLQQKTLQLENQLESQIKNTEIEKQELLEKTLLEQFPINTQCIYYGIIDNKSLGKAPRLHNEDLIKFGQSNNLVERIKSHKKNFMNFRLVAAFKVKNKIEIENAIKKHSVLKERIRSITVEKPNYEDENYRELLSYDNNEFTIEKIHGYIIEIIKENEYNIENYNKLIEKNNYLECDLREKKKEINKLKYEVDKLSKELEKFTPDITTSIQKKISSNFTICNSGYYIYAFECEKMKYKCSITRQKDFETLINNLKCIDTIGEIKYHIAVQYPFTEKIMMFLLKKSMTLLGNNKFEGSYENIKLILDISARIEKILIENANDLNGLFNYFEGIGLEKNDLLDPETPIIRKAKRPIDQIDKDTGKIISTYESIEAAGRSIGLTTGTAIGIALREKRVCQGFIWRYSGVSREDQFTNQPVIKICCNNGEKTYFNTIAEAAEDVKISAPGLRSRILTNLHVNGHHWIFNKLSTHYNNSTII
jgi:phage anti-repressor protein